MQYLESRNIHMYKDFMMLCIKLIINCQLNYNFELNEKPSLC